ESHVVGCVNTIRHCRDRRTIIVPTGPIFTIAYNTIAKLFRWQVVDGHDNGLSFREHREDNLFSTDFWADARPRFRSVLSAVDSLESDFVRGSRSGTKG